MLHTGSNFVKTMYYMHHQKYNGIISACKLQFWSVRSLSLAFTTCGHKLTWVQSIRHPSWLRDLAKLRAKANRISFTFSSKILFASAEWSCTVISLSPPGVPPMSGICPSPRSSSMQFSNSYVSSEVRTMSFDSRSGNASVRSVIQKLEKKTWRLTSYHTFWKKQEQIAFSENNLGDEVCKFGIWCA